MCKSTLNPDNYSFQNSSFNLLSQQNYNSTISGFLSHASDRNKIWTETRQGFGQHERRAVFRRRDNVAQAAPWQETRHAASTGASGALQALARTLGLILCSACNSCNQCPSTQRKAETGPTAQGQAHCHTVTVMPGQCRGASNFPCKNHLWQHSN